MKNQWLPLVLITLFVQTATAQSPNQKNALSFSGSVFDYYSLFNEKPLQAEGNTTYGVKLGYHRNLFGPVNLELPLRIGTARIPTPNDAIQSLSDNTFLGSLDALLQIQAFKPTARVVPFLSGGVGGVYKEDTDFDVQFPVGAGLEIKLSDNFYIHARSDYRFSSNEIPSTDKKLDNLNHNVGVKVLLGKPKEKEDKKDTDGDGVPDLVDECPLEKGTLATKGCPDSDGDGIADKDDECPTQAGLARFNGCPDSDADGVPDHKDECPDEVGTIALNGCPDRDGDGVADKNDDCPNEFGLTAFKGCPDRDGDGVPDYKDDCPDEFGAANNNGCPLKEIRQEDKETLDFATKNIEFEINSSYFKQASFPILDRVVDILQRYPQYHVKIDGHTDNVGEANYNQWLSERRAQRCYEYFISKGIAPSRMEYKGYGQTNPIASNSSESGRKLNRRVEFNLYLP